MKTDKNKPTNTLLPKTIQKVSEFPITITAANSPFKIEARIIKSFGDITENINGHKIVPATIPI